MIRAEKEKVMLHGDGATLLAELSCIVASLKQSGIPDDALVQCTALGLSLVKAEHVRTEDDELADNFMRELMKRVMEKRNAQTDKGNGDQ